MSERVGSIPQKKEDTSKPLATNQRLVSGGGSLTCLLRRTWDPACPKPSPAASGSTRLLPKTAVKEASLVGIGGVTPSMISKLPGPHQK